MVKAVYSGRRPLDAVSQLDNRVPVERETNCLRLQDNDLGGGALLQNNVDFIESDDPALTELLWP